MTSSSRRCTRAMDAGSSSTLTRTDESGLPECRVAQGPALTCTTQLCSTAPPKAADSVPALLGSLQGLALLCFCIPEPAGLWAVHICWHGM